MEFHKVVSKIEESLISNNIWFEKFEHEAVRTSKEAANVRSDYTQKQGAKALIVRIKRDGEKKFAMIVLPGDIRFDTKLTKSALDVKDIRFASEKEVEQITEGVLPGGVPPFGNLFNLEVFADKSIFDNEKIIFNAGDKRVSIGMFSKDYNELVKPNIVSII